MHVKNITFLKACYKARENLCQKLMFFKLKLKQLCKCFVH